MSAYREGREVVGRKPFMLLWAKWLPFQEGQATVHYGTHHKAGK